MAGTGLNRLTASEVTKALRAGSPTTLQDGGSLSLVVTAGGGRGKWLYRGRKAGSQTLIDLVCGYAPETGLSAARAKRDEFKLLLRQGINPNEQKRQAIAEAKRREREAGLTFLAVAAEYFRKRAAEGVTAKTLQTDRGRIANHVAPLIGSTPIARITRQDLKPIIDRLAAQNTYTQAGRVAGLVERVFSFAVDAGYIQGTPAEHLGRLVPKQLRATQKHHAAVTTSAGAAALFRRLWAYMESGRSGPHMVAAMKLSCYLPVRNGNMIEARWEHLDLDSGIWAFPQTKNGRAYALPMSRQIQAVFKELALYRRGAWCFPSGTKSGHISNNGMAKILRMSGIPQDEQSLHGFRATFETLALEAGLPKILCERVLFHVAGDATEQAYNRAQYLEPVRLALQWWADTVDSLRNGGDVPPVPDALRGVYQ